jgi:hypothetical protein
MNTEAVAISPSVQAIHDRIARLRATEGPKVQRKEIIYNGAKEAFHFRVLPFIEMDELRMYAFIGPGIFDARRAAGHNARLVALSLCDEGGRQVCSVEEVGAWPTLFVDELAKLATEVNKANANALEETVKNSETTDGGSTS